jgi:hypothetical protein
LAEAEKISHTGCWARNTTTFISSVFGHGAPGRPGFSRRDQQRSRSCREAL